MKKLMATLIATIFILSAAGSHAASTNSLQAGGHDRLAATSGARLAAYGPASNRLEATAFWPRATNTLPVPPKKQPATAKQNKKNRHASWPPLGGLGVLAVDPLLLALAAPNPLAARL